MKLWCTSATWILSKAKKVLLGVFILCQLILLCLAQHEQCIFVVYKLKYLLGLVHCLMKYETSEIVSNPAVLLPAHATGVPQGSAMAPLLHMLIIIGTLAFSPCCTSIAGKGYIRSMGPSPSTVLGE